MVSLLYQRDSAGVTCVFADSRVYPARRDLDEFLRGMSLKLAALTEPVRGPEPTPTHDSLPRRCADFSTLVEAVDYAALGRRGANFYSARGDLGEVLSYLELGERAREVGRKLVALGYEKGERVALIAATMPDFVVQFFGCQYASVLPVPLPLPTSFGGREGYIAQLRTQLQSCDAAAILGPQSMLSFVEEAGEGLGLRFCGSFEAFDALDVSGDALRLPAADDVAYLQYSSGSTRFPHGVAVTHRALLNNCAGQGGFAMALREDDRCITWLPFYHDMGLVGTLLTPLANQVSVDFLATEDFARRPLQWIELMSRNRGTISYAPTFGYDICSRRLGAESAEKYDISAWRVAGIGGDMIRPDVLRRFADSFAPAGFRPETFVPSYGLAECTLAVTIARLDRGVEVDEVDEAALSDSGGPVDRVAGGSLRRREVVNCGRLLPGYELEIRNRHGDALGSREIGRIFVRGPSVMVGYFGDEEATRAVLSADGWLDTGDMGYVDEDSLFVIGRAKDMIIVNGRNHWPQDIEWAVEQLPGLRQGDVAAISLPGEQGEEIPAVLVHCRLRDDAERRDFADTVRRRVQASTGILCRVELVMPRTLPRTSSGKLSRTRTRRQFLDGEIVPLAL